MLHITKRFPYKRREYKESLEKETKGVSERIKELEKNN